MILGKMNAYTNSNQIYSERTNNYISHNETYMNQSYSNSKEGYATNNFEQRSAILSNRFECYDYQYTAAPIDVNAVQHSSMCPITYSNAVATPYHRINSSNLPPLSQQLTSIAHTHALHNQQWLPPSIPNHTLQSEQSFSRSHNQTLQTQQDLWDPITQAPHSQQLFLSTQNLPPQSQKMVSINQNAFPQYQQIISRDGNLTSQLQNPSFLSKHDFSGNSSSSAQHQDLVVPFQSQVPQSSAVHAHNLSRKFQCKWEIAETPKKLCNGIFNDISESVNHVHEEHMRSLGSKQHVCMWEGCKRRLQPFRARYRLIAHIRVHTKEKPFTCRFCGKQFARSENVKIHERTHTGEKPYSCPDPGCNKRFGNCSDRKKHSYTHRTTKSLRCKFKACNRCYSHPCTLYKHIRSHY